MTTRQWLLSSAYAKAMAGAFFFGTAMRPTVSAGLCAVCLAMAIALGASALSGVYNAGKEARKEEERRWH